MSDWAAFSMAMLAFLSSHFVPRLGGLRERLIDRFGRRLYFSAYGMLSLVLLVWVIVAANQAPFVELWPRQPWMRWLPNIFVPLAFVLASCGIGVANANTLGGARNTPFDPKAPGFAAVSRHPLLVALLFWALAHLVANGDLAHVLLFGSFVAFPLLAMWGFDKKTARLVGEEADVFFTKTSWFSFAPFIDLHWWHQNLRPLFLRSTVGLVLWIAALHLHAPVIGVWPLP